MTAHAATPRVRLTFYVNPAAKTQIETAAKLAGISVGEQVRRYLGAGIALAHTTSLPSRERDETDSGGARET